MLYFCRMKQLTAITIIAFLFSCKSGPAYKKAEDAQDAGREFIRASLDGDYKKARFYMLNDPDNILLIDKQEANYRQLTNEEKNRYREASIRPLAIQKETDSITNYTYYQTSNPKDTTTIRVVLQNGEWLVDLKSVIKE